MVSDDKQVGIVLVSHSAEVAASVAELAKGLAGGGTSVPVAPAGGTEGGGIGTSSELIAAAARPWTGAPGSPCSPTSAAPCSP